MSFDEKRLRAIERHLAEISLKVSEIEALLEAKLRVIESRLSLDELQSGG